MDYFIWFIVLNDDQAAGGGGGHTGLNLGLGIGL